MTDGGTNNLVLEARDGAVTTLTLNRPDRGNSLNRALRVQLLAALEAAAGDAAVRAVVLTGAGRSFSVGQDLVEHADALQSDPDHAIDVVSEYNPIVMTLSTMAKPVLCAINGTCVGAALGFALACDLRITAAGTRFATAFSGIGLAADSGLSASLARAVGGARAAELLLLGEPFTAEQAADWGLSGRLVPAEDLPGDAAALAMRLAAGPTLAYAAIKESLANAGRTALWEVLAAEAEAQTRLGASEDHGKAVQAFLAKEQPTFNGR